MGATMREDGQLGGREIMLRPNGTGLQMTADNHRKVSLGVMTQEHFDALFPPPGTTPGSAPPAPPSPERPAAPGRRWRDPRRHALHVRHHGGRECHQRAADW